MKITNKQLKQIIKEEVDKVMKEEQSSKISSTDIKVGKEMQNTPIGNAIFKNLDKDPEVQKALEQLKQQMNEEDEPNAGAQYGMMGLVGGAANAALPFRAALFSGLEAGALKPAIVGALKALGIIVPQMIGGALVGYLIYKLGAKAIQAMSSKGEE
jgi:hypothetical protein